MGRGATFIVELPAQESQSNSRASAAALDVDLLPGAGSGLRLDGLRVLVIDDDGDGREFMEQALASHGAEVISVSSAKDALVELERTLPDVMVSDIAMPEVDGYELVQRVRALPAERGGCTPALAITAHASKEIHERALESGFHRYTAKPVDVETFVAAVAELGRAEPTSHGQ
ncbi:MAG: response regulator [Polyangiaceae bacterium]